MRKRIVQGITLIGLMMFCMGCSKKIANDEISIQKYKGLEVAEESGGEISEEKVWEALMAECTVDEFPEDEVTELIEQLQTEYGYAAYYKGMTAEELIKEKTGKTAEELAKEQLRREYAIRLIAEKEDLTVDDEEYEKLLKEAAGDTDSSEYESMFGKETLMGQFLEKKVLDFLIENLK